MLGALGNSHFGLMLALDESTTDRVVDALEQGGAVIGQRLKLHAIRVLRQHCERVKGNVTERERNGVVEQREFFQGHCRIECGAEHIRIASFG
ncbi:unannotated protein [freshwater metagenome]|uniref:Unannotated protein n=1 Tax=freshwater metagenome TaxID=449393 RepID=A0A6J6EJH2_9ZZZZ